MPRNVEEGIGLGLEVLLPQHGLEPLLNGDRSDAPEIEPLEPGHHRCRHGGNLVGLGGGEHEDDPRGGFFQNFQERVPGLPGQHVGLVDDIDLVVPLLRGRIHGTLAQLPGVVDPAIAGGVDLDHVQAGGAVPDA